MTPFQLDEFVDTDPIRQRRNTPPGMQLKLAERLLAWIVDGCPADEFDPELHRLIASATPLGRNWPDTDEFRAVWLNTPHARQVTRSVLIDDLRRHSHPGLEWGSFSAAISRRLAAHAAKEAR